MNYVTSLMYRMLYTWIQGGEKGHFTSERGSTFSDMHAFKAFKLFRVFGYLLQADADSCFVLL